MTSLMAMELINNDLIKPEWEVDFSRAEYKS